MISRRPPAVRADELAFLPPAMALRESPPHPMPRLVMGVLTALVLAAIAWACWAEVDIVAVAPGRIVVRDGTKTIQPAEAGVVRAVYVRDGDRVRAGQTLVELDPTPAQVDRQTVEHEIESSRSEVRRLDWLLGRMKAGAAGSSNSPDAMAHVAWEDLASRSARLDAEAARRQAERTTLGEVIAKLEATLPMARQREADIRALSEQGFVAGHAGQDRTRERIELERDLATQRSRLHEADAAIGEARRARQALVAEAVRQFSERRLAAVERLSRAELELARTMRRESLQRLDAPVAGRVQQLAVRTAGSVVAAAQPLLVIVPENADVTAEVVIDNRDIGFVKEGLAARLKIESFDFTRHGTVDARVVRLNADAVADEQGRAVYIATLSLANQELGEAPGSLRLVPGMNIRAEIALGRRRIVDYLIGTAHRVTTEAGREL